MLGPGLLATFSLTSAYVLANFRPGVSLLKSKREILLVDSLYTEAIEAVKSQAALWASSPQLIWILSDII
jgi:hypothetical protein